MNDNHQRHLLSTFRHIEYLLSEAERALRIAGEPSPFAGYTQDSTPAQRKEIGEAIGEVRHAMVRAISELGLQPPAPVCSALWAAKGQVALATVAVAEMEPERMRGYGQLSETDCQTIGRIVEEMNAALERLAAVLEKSSQENQLDSGDAGRMRPD